MTIALDHFLVITKPGAPEAELLVDIGMIEGTSNDHPGQGTANRRFFFSNWGLELAYVRDAEEAQNGNASGLRVVERAADRNASPFGLIVRRATDGTDDPFPGWHYHPEYFSAEKYFVVGENSDVIEEPLCICMPIMAPGRPVQPPQAESFSHVTELIISVPVEQPSPVLQSIAGCDGVTMRFGEPHCMEIEFRDGVEWQLKDLRPNLPLILRW